MMKNLVTKPLQIHASAIQIWGIGVLIRGNSGVGKTDLILELIKNKHQLIADDMVKLTPTKNKLMLSGNNLTRETLHVRGIGLIDVATIYGSNALCKKCKLRLIIDLVDDDKNPSSSMKELNNNLDNHSLLEPNFGYTQIIDGIITPCFTFKLKSNRPNPLLIELIVKIFKLQNKDFVKKFIKKQKSKVQ